MVRDKINLQYHTYDVTDSIGNVSINKQSITSDNGIELEKALACKDNSLTVIIESTASSDSIIQLIAGDMQNMQLGNSSVPIKASSVMSLRIRDIARYERMDGSIYFDFPTGFTGYIYAVGEKAGLGS